MYQVVCIARSGATQQEYSMEVQPKDVSKNHFYVSLIKSGIRILAALALIDNELVVAGSLFVIAEVLGVLEEVV